MNITSFDELGIPIEMINKLAEFEIKVPSPVQAEVIPAVLQRKDVLAHSQTGTGKTLAYLLPMLMGIDPEMKSIQKLIIAPTQELAMQIVRESERYGEQSGVRVLALIGGASTKRQLEKLRLHPQLIVGTPGRIRELVETRKVKMHNVNSIVVDEVDQVFQLGAAGDVSKIIRSAMRDRQLVFLSATISKESADLVSREMKEPVLIGIAPEQMTASGLEHYYFITEERDKPDVLRRLIRHYNPEKALVFVNATDDIAVVEAKMNHLGISTQALYGDANKLARSGVLDRFRKGKFKLLVASDLAARGLDIEGLTLVVNYDPPVDSEHYVHRAGRTGRMGRSGIVLSIVTDRQTFIIKKFTKELHTPIGLRIMSSGKVIKPGEEIPRNTTYTKPAKMESTEPKQSSKNTVLSVASVPVLPTPSAEVSRKSNRAATGASKSERERVRKNKGAPKWLKNKPPRS
ncbi:DEAD/DEAH box helicase [Paenibacillus crassostreae]|uniref:DEAD/DEAH box helicase n=1 Tax=Paenibacillus crassostreae TaxID=1763538 RepID=A0A167GG69_9BACL|nr:DEAD/DEAH box helicase [Paenibacillus crassostreae]AOZ91975.1 DEAD/DEAH box helicase [Paenibacillus crassostreae]OAB77542.1 DEAD/DEAH box helicase [Paenibacillus crassostreae]